MRISAGLMPLLVALAACPAHAGTWDLGIDSNLTLTENAYSDNWSGGETGTLSWALNGLLSGERPLGSSLRTTTRLKLAFGQTHSQNVESGRWAAPVTSTDLVDLESVLRITRGWLVDPYASGRVETQFLDRSDAEKTRHLNPAVFTEGVGVARDVIGGEDAERRWMVRLGGAVRQHLDRDVLDPLSGMRSDVTSSDGGVELRSEFGYPLAGGKIALASDLTAYRALYNSSDSPGDDWQTVDLNWENTLTAGITSYLMVNLYVQALYDKEVAEGVRYKETLSLGVTFKRT
jgi:hypothetical protein